MTLLVALLGGVVIYQEQIAGYIRACASIVAGVGGSRGQSLPQLDLPTPEQAIAKGKGKGRMYLDKLLGSSPVLRQALGAEEEQESLSPGATSAGARAQAPEGKQRGVKSVQSPESEPAQPGLRAVPVPEKSKTEKATKAPEPKARGASTGPTPLLGPSTSSASKSNPRKRHPPKSTAAESDGPAPL
jgi:hypothetical protein